MTNVEETPFEAALRYDRQALADLGRDVAAVSDADLALATPCDGWTVRDLIRHMNTEHAAICGTVVDESADPRVEFTRIATRWLSYFAEAAGGAVPVPKVGREVPSELVLSIHYADMVVHRWDLAVSVGAQCTVDPDLLRAARTVGEAMTRPERGMSGDDGVYDVALESDPTATELENLVRLYGRDHRFNS